MPLLECRAYNQSLLSRMRLRRRSTFFLMWRPKDLQQMTEVLCSRWTGAPHVCNQKKVPGDPFGHQHIYKTISYMKSTIHIYCNGKHGFQKFSKPLRCPRMSTSPPETSKYSTLSLWLLKDEEAAKEVMHFLTFDTTHVTSILVWRPSSLIPLFHVSLNLSQTAQCLWEQPSRSGSTTIWYKLMGKNNLFFSFPIKLHWKKSKLQHESLQNEVLIAKCVL